MKYYRLTSNTDKGTIVRTEGKIQHQYIKGKGWVRSGIMLEYFWPDSDLYEMYETITEKGAMRSIKEIENTIGGD